MADGGFQFAQTLTHAPGVYLDMPMSEYHADRAISGSGLKKLITNPVDWKWEHSSNPLYDEPKSDARALGTLVHVACLEGIEAFEARYCCAPSKAEHPDALDTADDLKGWLRERGIKLTGAKADLIERVLEHDPRAKIWDAFLDGYANGREIISAKADRYVRIVERFVRSDRDYHRLLSGGLPEVSVFWERDGQRFKARYDYMNFIGVADLKKFGRPPRIGQSLLQHVLSEAIGYGYHVQAVHNMRATEELREIVLKSRGEIVASGPNASERIRLLTEIAAAWWNEKPPTFHWVFVQTPGAPCGIAPEFDEGNLVWRVAEDLIDRALANHRAFTTAYGDTMWLRSEGIVKPTIEDFPIWSTDVPR